MIQRSQMYLLYTLFVSLFCFDSSYILLALFLAYLNILYLRRKLLLCAVTVKLIGSAQTHRRNVLHLYCRHCRLDCSLNRCPFPGCCIQQLFLNISMHHCILLVARGIWQKLTLFSHPPAHHGRISFWPIILNTDFQSPIPSRIWARLFPNIFVTNNWVTKIYFLHLHFVLMLPSQVSNDQMLQFQSIFPCTERWGFVWC